MAALQSLYRPLVLALAGNRVVKQFVLKYGFQLGAKRFVAGYTPEDAIREAERLKQSGMMTTLDQLGEAVQSLDESEQYRNGYLQLIDLLIESGSEADISLKPTQLGLALNRDKSYAFIRDIVQKASENDTFVRLDMEDTPFTEQTIRFAEQLREEGFDKVGTVIQAYLYRSEDDVRRLTESGMNLRLVKGAYKEPESLAMTSMDRIRDQFRRLIGIRLDSGVYTAIATHDESILEWTKVYAKENEISSDRFEFQMLYGMRSDLLEQLAREGYRVRSYVPYGRMWYPYFLRRLAERPDNLWFVLRNVLRR